MHMQPCGMIAFCNEFEFKICYLKVALSVHTTQPLTCKKRPAHACAVQPLFTPAHFPFVYIGVPHLALMHILLLSMCVQGASGHAVTDLIVR